ncbi:hypothetical protein PR048_001274 [Dryococelus australis]|uniref:Uncharacterized protein n=1 Tax=Dryococelus australis TaxID=614101 RepID=A0ABQ9IGX1_9NEOP|nr:hypothetical protein PR048_001274 [Dryococelus australis]
MGSDGPTKGNDAAIPKWQRMNSCLRDKLVWITLRYLLTGDSFGSLEGACRVPRATISKFLPEEHRPNESASNLYYYKCDYYSVIILAIVEDNCSFICTDVGTSDRVNDALSTLHAALENNTLNLLIEGIFMGVGGFPLTQHYDAVHREEAAYGK